MQQLPTLWSNRFKHISLLGLALFFANANAQQITVDPATPLTAGVGNFATEWNTAGNLQSWVASQTSATVSGGVLQGTTTGTDSSLSLSNFAGGPDLDLGWNDFVELRIQVPAAYNGAIQIFYGTTSYTIATSTGGTATAATTGFNVTTRAITIPAASIPKDGAFHTYRLDVGLVAPWRATLRDLRIDPLDGAGSSGMAFAIDYIRVGDEPNALVYQPIATPNCPATGGSTPANASFGPNQTVYGMESKHFRFLWNDAAVADYSWTPDMPHGTLRNCEEVWQVFAKKLGYRDPCFTFEDKLGTNGTTRGKINVTPWYEGFFAGGTGSPGATRGWLNILPGGLRVDPPTFVLPHEVMHVFQFFNNEDTMPGTWYEGHANYGRERWIEHYQFIFPGSATLEPLGVKYAHQIMCDGRDQYLTWMPFLYMDSNPDNLPDLGEGTSPKVWQQSVKGDNPFELLDTIAPITGKKNIFGRIGQRGATLNYPVQPFLASTVASDVTIPRFQYTDLVQRQDDPTWWKVPYEMAPQQGAYTIHELVASNPGTAGRTVTVNFHGLPNSARAVDWRAGFVVVADNGTERYSSLWSSGNNSVTLAANENKLYLTVAGTPDVFAYADFDEVKYSYRSSPGKARMPYEVQVTGATPRERNNGASTGLVQHANGGGYKSTTANVAATAYIGPNARVLGTATVGGSARVEDYAVVQDSAKILGSAVVSGHAWIRNGATVRDNGRVRDWAMVADTAIISGNGRVLEHAEVTNDNVVTDTAVIKGTATAEDLTQSGNAIVDGNAKCYRDISNGFATGLAPYQGIPDSYITPLPTGLYTAYDFATAHDSRIIDKYGVTDGFTIGSPTWVASDSSRSGFLTFDGSSQFANLDRSVADTHDFSFTAWIKPAGGAANQAVLWLGASPTRRLYFTPDDGNGNARFSIANGGAEQSLTAPALATGVWTYVGITLDGTSGVFYINGNPVLTAPMTLRPDQLLAPNTTTGLQHNYLARAQGTAMPMFNGSLDEVRLYSSAITPAKIAEELSPLPMIIGTNGSFGSSSNTKDKVFDGDLTTYFDGPDASGNWVGMDLGTAQQITQVKYCPRDSWAARMRNGKFQGSNVADFSSGVVNLYTISQFTSPASGVLTTQNVTNTSSFRYVRYLGPNNGYCDIAELEFVSANPPVPPVPGAPTNLTASPGSDQASLSWHAAANAASYNVKRATSSGGPYTVVGSSLLQNYTDTTATGGTTYYYVVSAVNGFNESANTNEASASPTGVVKVTGTVIGTPGSYDNSGNTIAKVFDGNFGTYFDGPNPSGNWAGLDLGSAKNISQVRYCPRTTWASRMVGGVFQGSNVANFSSGVVTLFTIGSTPPEGELTAQDISDLGTYRYVRYLSPANGYCNVAELEFYSKVVSLSAPTNLAAAPGDNQVGLAWTAVSGATGYNVKRSTTNGGPYAVITTASTNAYTDTGVVNGTTYYYVVSALNGPIESANSNQASALPQPPVPPVPANLVATAGDNQVGLTWTASAGAVSYNVKRSTTSGGSFAMIANVTTTSYTNTGLVNGMLYYYVVTAVNAGGESVNSLEANATPMPPIPPVPANVVATAGDNQVGLAWTASAGATSYNVKRSITSGGSYTTIASPATASFTDITAVNGTTYYYAVSAVNIGGESANSGEASAMPLSALQSWRMANFHTTENTGSAADDADPDGDGLKNVLEYFHGTNPNEPTASPLQVTLEGNRLKVLFPRDTSENDLTVNVQGSDSLEGPWTDLARSIDGAAFTPQLDGVTVSDPGTSGISPVEVQDLYLTMDPERPRRFMRISVQAQ